jgi:double-strand break repair protein MRE11
MKLENDENGQVGMNNFLNEEDILDEKDTFRILMATDIHLGYKDVDPIRFDDSFRAFEETLQHANSTNSDFMLLGGDLFDRNKPPARVMRKAANLLSKYIKEKV